MNKNDSKPEISWFTRCKVALAALAFAAAAVAGTTAMDAPDAAETDETAGLSIAISADVKYPGGGVSYSRSVTWS